jgi:dTDP-4-dehydrorhamnose 3,5-epimerase
MNVLLIEARRLADDRGWFSETYSRVHMAKLGILSEFPQDNQSWSRRKGTLRGLHFQRPPHAQAKLVSCLKGRILDVVVDIRVGSPTFGKSLTVELMDNGDQLFVPEGFAHGFISLTDDVIVAYKVSSLFDPALDAGLAWDDPDLGILWPVLSGGPIMSDRDRRLPRLASLDSPFRYGGGGPLSLTFA